MGKYVYNELCLSFIPVDTIQGVKKVSGGSKVACSESRGLDFEKGETTDIDNKVVKLNIVCCQAQVHNNTTTMNNTVILFSSNFIYYLLLGHKNFNLQKKALK